MFNSALKKLLPFVGAGVLIAFFLVSIVFFAYVLFWGLVIACVLFVVAWIKKRFFPQKTAHAPNQKIKGQVYEHEDFKS
ncbi:hypothetical protein [Piscirickettsia litoralis]|uniref:Uncharacterized protein n=1 Tax=Piscirickettsia litoralis TaxID=1891921 RepID=A0ABX3A7M5_9GAMM|nr:hypothetical protein [Piscirickettsia litoralis]ODN43435.1 hypothetical protein BGC07_11540 [Piscirickettsia litoralis]